MSSTMEVSTFLNHAGAGESDEFPECLHSENFNDNQQELYIAPSPAPCGDALPAPRFVDCGDAGIASLNRKSRTAAFAFPLQPIGTEKSFVEGIASRITLMHTNKIPNSGFRIRHASYFSHEERLWLVLVSRDSLYFIKWNTIFRNLCAENIRVYYVDVPEERIGGRTSSGLVATLDMFPHLTIEELVDNSVNILKPLVGLFFSGLARIVFKSCFLFLCRISSRPSGGSRASSAGASPTSRHASGAGGRRTSRHARGAGGRRTSPRPAAGRRRTASVRARRRPAARSCEASSTTANPCRRPRSLTARSIG